MNKIIDENIEKVKFKCSIKNCKKGIAYKIIIINKEKSLGDCLSFETQELKKIGTIKVKQIDPQKKEIKNTQINLMQQLKEQIHLRYINLKKHENESEDGEDEDWKNI